MILGAHQSIAGGVSNAITRAIADDCQSLQIFVKSPNKWSSPPIPQNEIVKFKKTKSFFNHQNITAHSAFLINIASPKDDVYEKSKVALLDELSRCDILEIPYLVMHPGSPLNYGLEFGIERIVNALDEIFENNSIKTTLLLENTAGDGNTIGKNFDELLAIIESSNTPEKIGICLDSCHMFSAGYDIVKDYESISNKIYEIFHDKLKIFHLNDSKFSVGSRKDRHENIGNGFIGEDFFRKIVNDPKFSSILGILETPIQNENDSYLEEIKKLKSYIKGE